MNSVDPRCPLLAAPAVHFNAYTLHTDYWCYPVIDDVAERAILRYRYENPDPFVAHSQAMHTIQNIKALMERVGKNQNQQA